MCLSVFNCITACETLGADAYLAETALIGKLFLYAGEQFFLALKLLTRLCTDEGEKYACKELKMSIGATYPIPPPTDPLLFSEVPCPAGFSEDSLLSRITGSVAFSSVVPTIQAALEQMETSGVGMLKTLADNISRLQDAFLGALYTELDAMGVNLSAKLTLRLNSETQLTVSGEHPDAKAISGLLVQHPEFSVAFTEIAAQSAALRDLRSLHAMVLCASSPRAYAVLSSYPGETSYQLSLKGEMNHFYFTG